MPAFRQAGLALVAASALLLGASPVAGPSMWFVTNETEALPSDRTEAEHHQAEHHQAEHHQAEHQRQKPNTSFPGILDGNNFPALCHNGDISPDALSLVIHAINRRTELFGLRDEKSSETLHAAQHGGVDFSQTPDYDRARNARMIVAGTNILSVKGVSPVVSSVIGHEEVTLAVEKGYIAKPARESYLQLYDGASGLAAEEAGDKGLKPVIMNFSNGELPCGGYLNGTLQQEEALCLEYPRLLPALWQAKQCGFYPNGSAAGRMAFSESPRPPIEAVTDVIFTPAIPRERRMEQNWKQKLAAVTPEQGQGRGHAFVSVAAPNVYNSEHASYMLQQMETAFLAPKLFDPTIEAFIGGPWGADGFGTPPEKIASLWAEIWKKHNGLYKVVTLAVPPPTVFPRLLHTILDNHNAFLNVFRSIQPTSFFRIVPLKGSTAFQRHYFSGAISKAEAIQPSPSAVSDPTH